MEKLILSEDEITRICSRLGKEIDEDIKQHSNGIPVILGIMNGGLPFMYELIKHIESPILLDTIRVSTYQGITQDSEVKVYKEPDHNLKGKDVYIVEDIIDTGLTMHFLREYITKNYKPANLKVCTLIKRTNFKQAFDEKADFIGIETDEQRYIVGFGFDYYGLFRNTPYIFVPSIKDIKAWNEALTQEDEK